MPAKDRHCLETRRRLDEFYPARVPYGAADRAEAARLDIAELTSAAAVPSIIWAAFRSKASSILNAFAQCGQMISCIASLLPLRQNLLAHPWNSSFFLKRSGAEDTPRTSRRLGLMRLGGFQKK